MPRRRWTAAVIAVALVAALTACQPTPSPPGTIVVGDGNGFGGGTIYRPAGPGPHGAVAVAPGFSTTQSSIAWYGPLLADAGFIVITIDTNSRLDGTSSRATQLLAALDYLTTSSAVAADVDPDRLAVMGWSMGGGGALRAARERPDLKAAIPLAAWDTTTDFSSNVVPTLFVSCQMDLTAPTSWHSYAQYESMPATTPRAYLDIAGGSHRCVTGQDDTIAEVVVEWMRYFVDGDAGAPVCPATPEGGPVSWSESTCPF